MHRSSCIVPAILLTLASAAAAADHDATLFPKGTVTLDTYGAFASGLEAPTENLSSASIGAGYFIFDNFSLTLDLSGFRAIQTGDNAWMAAFSGGLRHF